MEIRNNEMKNKNVNIENGDMINGDKITETTIINNNYYMTLENTPQLAEFLIGTSKENKEEYSDLYKKYINKFKELENYAMSLIYPKFIKKEYNFSSNTLIFGKKIVDWIFGISEYPFNEIEILYKELREEFEIKEESILGKRWNANKMYFEGKLLDAKNGYIDLKNDINSNNEIPYWLKDDILIDGRNILNKYDNSMDQYTYSNPFQEEINKNKHKLSYPDVDRIKADIFEKVSENVFNNKNKGKYTTIIGIGLEDILNNIQNLAYITIFYGSITHLKLVRILIAEVMYMYADTFEDEEFYKITLKMLFLAGERKKYKNLFNKLKLDYHFVNSRLFVNELVSSLDTTISFEKLGNEIFIYDLYGRILENEIYNGFESRMLDNIEITEDYHMLYITDIFKSIPSNLSRFNDISRLLKIIMDYLEKDYSRFFYEFGKILNNIDIKTLSEENFKIYKSIIDKILTLKDRNIINISYAIINIKEYKPEIRDYDEILSKKKTFESIIYNLEDDRNIRDSLKDIIEICKDRYKEREDNPGVAVGYVTEYYLERNFFIKEVYEEKTHDIIIKEYIPLAKLILLSENQFIREKVKIIKTLSYILLVEEDKKIKEDIINSINNSELSKYEEDFTESREKTKADLKNNILMANYIYENIKVNQLFSKYLERSLNDPSQIEEILNCIKIIKDKLNGDKEFNPKLYYYLFINAYKENDIEIRNKLIELSDIFINTDCEEEILEMLNDCVDNLSYEECVGYIKLLIKVPKNEIYKYEKIIEKLKNNANYNVRIMVEKYIVKE